MRQWTAGANVVCLCLFFRFGGSRFDKVWGRVEEFVQGNFHGYFHRRHRFGLARHAGCLRGGAEPDAIDGASMTTSVGKGNIIGPQNGQGIVAYTCGLYELWMTYASKCSASVMKRRTGRIWLIWVLMLVTPETSLMK